MSMQKDNNSEDTINGTTPDTLINPLTSGRPKKIDTRDAKSRTGFPKRPQFTMEQINTAVEVMKYSKIVRNWVLSELRAYGIDATSTKGQKFIAREMENAARKSVE